MGLDSSVFILHIEGNPKYGDLADAIFTWLEGPRAEAVTSTITMLELLVQPYRLSDIDRVNEFYALLSSYPHLEWVAPRLEVADLGTKLRAEHNLRTPDALQAATAIACSATAFISNDPVFQRLGSLEIAILDDFVR
ncbi:MAG: type II toxin-antitoxin system VapC family toxin [Candidatus Binatia bacterium]